VEEEEERGKKAMNTATRRTRRRGNEVNESQRTWRPIRNAPGDSPRPPNTQIPREYIKRRRRRRRRRERRRKRWRDRRRREGGEGRWRCEDTSTSWGKWNPLSAVNALSMTLFLCLCCVSISEERRRWR